MIKNIKKFYTASLKHQLIISIALVHTVMMSIFIYDLVKKEGTFLIEQHTKSAKSLSKTLASSSTSWVLSNDFVGLKEILTSMQNYPGVKYIIITNIEGEILSHTSKRYIGLYLSDDKSIEYLKGEVKTKIIFENSDYIDVVSPILRENQHIGWARISLSKELINKSLDDVILNGLFYTLLAIIIGVIVGYFISIGITKNIYKILQVIQKVKGGKKNIYSNVNRDDEIGILSKEFDYMLQKISEQTTLIDSVMKSSPDLIFYKDYSNFDGVYIGCNDQFSNFVGRSKDDIIGKTDFDLFDNKLALFFRKNDKLMLKSQKPYKNEEWVKYPDGSDILLESIKTPLYNLDGSILGVLGNSRDITQKYHDQKELEEKNKILFDQSKLASMGEMIGNIAHQWRQPLSVISTGATGLKLLKEYNTLTDQQFLEACDSINDNAQYLSKTIDDFKDFIKGERKKVKFNLSKDINSFLHLVEGSIKNNNIHLEKDIQDDIEIYGYPNELIQCFINIFNNSKDALKDLEDNRYIYISTSILDNKVIITFKDNAGGIDDEILNRIYEPYFTTKHKSQGTGLGLSMTYSLVVDGMGGSIETKNDQLTIDGKKYKGAITKITLEL